MAGSCRHDHLLTLKGFHNKIECNPPDFASGSLPFLHYTTVTTTQSVLCKAVIPYGQTTVLAGKIEGANSEIAEDTENLTFKRKEISELSSKLDKAEEYSMKKGTELSHDESQNDKVMESMKEAISNIDNTCGDCSIHTEHGAEGEASDGLSFLFVKEVKIDELEETIHKGRIEDFSMEECCHFRKLPLVPVNSARPFQVVQNRFTKA
ncbi:hypothetical protein GH733_017678 [Mirounga leonina]|nr:hypothetical protein GH733_017678 [Mirounga leonina]